ncbi:hypothetical protein [Azorhizophilus paspali]|uniref:Uncharacterized protein n=1 Tax=Azorhizophilus paspali TaxID=69963 RepID=A0ABV6SG30_AZOPA
MHNFDGSPKDGFGRLDVALKMCLFDAALRRYPPAHPGGQHQ